MDDGVVLNASTDLVLIFVVVIIIIVVIVIYYFDGYSFCGS
jgi:hypothetical protein